MGPELIVIIPGLLALWFCFADSPERAFLSVYLPVLLLIPDYFRLPIDGFPDPSFSQATILPIGVLLCWQALRGRWNFSPLDFAVLAFLVWSFISDFHGEGFGDAQNMFFDTLTLALFPYMAGKRLIEPAGLRVAAARRIVWLLFLVCLLSVYEFKMGASLFRPAFQIFFQNTIYRDSLWYTQIRWGFGRIAGPYGSAILMAAILSMGYLLHRWLERNGHWEPSFAWLPGLPLAKARLIGVTLIASCLMTMSRGPWIGAAGGLTVAAIGTARNTRHGILRAGTILAMGGALLYTASQFYGAASPVAPEEQASAAYRKLLLDQYTGIALQHSFLGWGRFAWPHVPGMASVDNWYLLLTLMHGVTGMVIFTAMVALVCVRLFSRGLKVAADPGERTFLFALLGILISVMISVGTVFLGAQLYPLLFLFLGWSEACLLSQPARTLTVPAASPVDVFRFARVIA